MLAQDAAVTQDGPRVIPIETPEDRATGPNSTLRRAAETTHTPNYRASISRVMEALDNRAMWEGPPRDVFRESLRDWSASTNPTTPEVIPTAHRPIEAEPTRDNTTALERSPTLGDPDREAAEGSSPRDNIPAQEPSTAPGSFVRGSMAGRSLQHLTASERESLFNGLDEALGRGEALTWLPFAILVDRPVERETRRERTSLTHGQELCVYD